MATPDISLTRVIDAGSGMGYWSNTTLMFLAVPESGSSVEVRIEAAVDVTVSMGRILQAQARHRDIHYEAPPPERVLIATAAGGDAGARVLRQAPRAWIYEKNDGRFLAATVADRRFDVTTDVTRILETRLGYIRSGRREVPATGTRLSPITQRFEVPPLAAGSTLERSSHGDRDQLALPYRSQRTLQSHPGEFVPLTAVDLVGGGRSTGPGSSLGMGLS